MIQVELHKDYNNNYITSNVQDCINFWNREGNKAYEENKRGNWGSKETNKMAREMPIDDFLLDMLLCDCKTFVNSPTSKKLGLNYYCGRTRSHVWLHDEDHNRMMMIYYK